MAKRFYYQVMGETFGPLSGVELRDRAMAGDVTTDTLVRINEDGDWVLASRLKNLFDERGLPISHSAILGPPPRPQAEQAAAASAPAATATAEAPATAADLADSPSDGIDFKPDASEANSVADLPDVPALYALYGGRGDGLFPAFVGMADDLKVRVQQHLGPGDFQVADHTVAIAINPHCVTEVRWWTHPGFLQRDKMEATLLVAYDVLGPLVRSEAGISEGARKLYSDPAFVAGMMELVKQRPAGHLVIRTLEDAWTQIDAQARRLAELERRVAQLEAK